MNFPGSKKLTGTDLAPEPGEGWTEIQVTWDWDGWVKKQVDYCVALGINVFGLTGCIDAIHAGTISQSTSNAHWAQLTAYCASLGVYVYPKPAAYNQLTGMTNAQIASSVLSTLGALASYPNVVGCDIILEANAWDDGAGASVQGTADRCNAIYTLVKAGTSLPCTYSITWEWTDTRAKDWAGKIATGMDYLDFHAYAMNGWGRPLVLADANYWLTNYPTSDIFFGEAGAPQSDTVDQINIFLRGVGAVATSGDRRFRGWQQWAAQDQDSAPNYSNMWGIFGQGWGYRQNIANVIRQFTGGSIARRN